MATLEKIRSKSVILFVIIIVALLAFILGDFLTSGRTYFGTGDKMAEANGASVKLDEFNNYRATQGENQTADPDVLEQQYLQTLMLQKLIAQQCDEAGIKITDSELSQWMINYDQSVRAFIGQMAYGFGLQPAYDEQSMAANINQVLERLKNPKKYQLPEEEAAKALNQWKEIERQAESNLRSQLYTMMLEAMYQPNDVDAQVAYAGAANRQIDLVAVSPANIADADVKVTDDDIKAVWTADKPQFKVKGEKRSLAYIVQPIQSTEEDMMAADQAVQQMLAALNADTTITLNALKSDAHFVSQTMKFTLPQLKGNYVGVNLAPRFAALAADSVKVGQTVLIDSRPGAYYVLGRLMGIEQKTDSLTFSQILYADATVADSLLNVAKTTQVWDSIGSGAMFAAMGGEKVSLHNPSQQSLASLPKVANLLRESAIGEVVTYTDTIQGQPVNALFRVDQRQAESPVYDIARIDYVVTPSNATRTKITGDFRNYLGNNASTKAFVDNAQKAGYTVEYALVDNGTATVGNLPDTRRLVKFAMEGDKGQVSPVVNSRIRMRQDVNERMPAMFRPVTPPDQDYLIAVALGEEYDDYIPWNDPTVKPRLEARAKNLKRSQMLADKYKAQLGNPEELAKAANSVVQASTFSFNSNRYPAEVAAAIVKAADGATPFSVVTPEGLFVVRVKSTAEPTLKLDENKDNYTQDFTTRFFPLGTQIGILNALIGDDTFDNHSLNFKQGFDD